MAEYISREDADLLLLKKAEDYSKMDANYAVSIIQGDRSIIRSIPAANVRENVRGKWYWDNDGYDWNIGAYRCSNCKSRPGTWWAGDRNKNPLNCSGGSFCGNCGADMRGAEDE